MPHEKAQTRGIGLDLRQFRGVPVYHSA